MRRSWLAVLLLGSTLTVACGQGQVVVSAEVEVPNPEGEGMVVRPIADTEIQLLPFDRDLVFDSLAEAFPTPEPTIPADLLEAQEAIAIAQEEWRAAEQTWGQGRARLQEITEEMEGLSRGEAQYVALFREFQDVEGEVSRAERVKDEAFSRFTALQEGYIQRADSMRLMREQWGDEAFASAGDVFLMKLRESGREILTDTTDAAGMAGFEVPPGQWWVYARHELPFSELYWNLPITVERGNPVQVSLSPSTAQVRPKL
ncbi:MAG: hypothetical protein ACWGSQ_02995 [Longimicrobiales bacterium]